MECPNCGIAGTDEAFGIPATCPECSVVYEKALRVKLLREQLEEQKKGRGRPEQDIEKGGVKRRFHSAAKSVSEGRKRRILGEFESKQKGLSRSVIVTDIDMPFWLIVKFMVKLMLASIPALLLFGFIIFGLLSLFGAFFTAIFS